jgi:hypothetical protein
VNRCPRFACSFVFLVMRRYYWRWNWNFTPLIGEAQRIKKNFENPLLVLRILPASLKGVASMPHFAYKRKVQRSANNRYFMSFLYRANLAGAFFLVAIYLFFQNSPINWAVLTGTGNMKKKNKRTFN